MPSKSTTTFSDDSLAEVKSSAQTGDPDKSQESPWLGCGCLLIIVAVLITILTMTIRSCGNDSESSSNNSASISSSLETTEKIPSDSQLSPSKDAPRWYSGGTLHKKTVKDWKKKQRNKIN